MEELIALAQGAGPEVVEAPEGENQEGQVEGQTAEGEGPEEAKKSEAAKRRERDKAHRARLQAATSAAEQRAAEAEARKQAILDAGKKEAPPKEEDFSDPLEFAAAKAIWGAEQRVFKREANGAEEAATAAKREAAAFTAQESVVIEGSWTTRLADARLKYGDFDAVALSDQVPVTRVMGDLIKTSDVGPDVAYFLGQHRALAEQIAEMNPMETARTIGRIEASLRLPKPRTATNAPDPITPVNGGSNVGRNPDKMSFAEWKAWREAGGKIS